MLIKDGIQDPKTVEFAVLEDLVYHDVIVKRRGRVGGKLAKGTATIFTSNRSPSQLFGSNGSIVVARNIVLNITGVPLFPFLDHIRQVHGIAQFLIPVRNIPTDYY